MLMIEDNVDLTELEKFGLKKEKDIYCYRNVLNSVVLMIFDNKKISNPYDDSGNDVLFDLIKANIVKKVEGK